MSLLKDNTSFVNKEKYSNKQKVKKSNGNLRNSKRKRNKNS